MKKMWGEIKRGRFNEDFERIIKLLLSDEAVELVRSLSLKTQNVVEEGKFKRVVEVAEGLEGK